MKKTNYKTPTIYRRGITEIQVFMIGHKILNSYLYNSSIISRVTLEKILRGESVRPTIASRLYEYFKKVDSNIEFNELFY